MKFLALSLIFFSAISFAQDASNYSGLKGKDLESIESKQLEGPSRNIKDLNIGDLIAVLGSSKDKNPPVIIKSVRVVEDRRTRLKLAFEYTTTRQPAALTVAAITSQGGSDKVKAVKLTLNEPSGESEVILDAINPWSTKEAGEFTTPGVSFMSGKANNIGTVMGSAALNGQLFGCTKKWLPVPQNTLAVPFGASIAGLPSQAPGAPAKLYLAQYKSMARDISQFTSSQTPPQPSSPLGGSQLRSIATLRSSSIEMFGRPPAGNGGPPPPKGPSANLIFDPSTFASSDKYELAEMPLVFQDQEPASGVYYYKPTRFALNWSPEAQYALKVIYGAAKADGNAPVTLAARLSCPISGSDLALIEKLIGESGMPFKALRPFPLGSQPVYGLANTLKNYGIPPDGVSIVGASEKGDEMELRIVTDAVTKETLETLLVNGLGLGGDVVFQSAKAEGAEAVPVSIPAMLRLSDPLSFGARPWVRGSDNKMPFKNDTPYPMRLDYANILWFSGSVKQIYNWSLGGVVLAPGESTSIDLSVIPAWMDGHPSSRRKWIQYTSLPDAMVDEVVLSQGTEGVAQVTQGEITVNLLAWKEKVKAVAILIEIRSRGFDSKQKEMITKSLTFENESEKQKAGPFYLPKTQDAQFEYRVGVVDADGNQKWGKNWIKSKNTNIFIGVKQIQDALDGNQR